MPWFRVSIPPLKSDRSDVHLCLLLICNLLPNDLPLCPFLHKWGVVFKLASYISFSRICCIFKGVHETWHMPSVATIAEDIFDKTILIWKKCNDKCLVSIIYYSQIRRTSRGGSTLLQCQWFLILCNKLLPKKLTKIAIIAMFIE